MSEEKKSGVSPVRAGIGLLVLVAIVGGVYYKLAPQSTRDTINRVASNAGVTITPWIDRAQAAVRAMLARPDQDAIIGKSILTCVHPTGTFVKLEKSAVRAEGTTLVVELQVAWKGGLLGTPYSTQVRWRAMKTGPVGCEVFGDNSAVKPDEKDVKKLDEYFRTGVWPAVQSNAGE